MPGLQLTTFVRRALRLVGAGDVQVETPLVGDRTQRVDELAELRYLELAPADRHRWDQAVAGSPDAVAVLRRQLASTGSISAVLELADHWDTWTPAVRDAVVDPVARLTRQARQTDQTTCGSACLVLLAAAGDPGLAGWLAAGTVQHHGSPTELDAASPSRLAELVSAPASVRFGILQHVVKGRSNARSVLGLPWPASLGTPPWGAAREARHLGLSFSHLVVDDTDAAHLHEVIGRLGRALDSGTPVPLYVGGDTSRGWSTALPRHVVLAVKKTPEGFVVWEPSAGALLELSTEVVLRGGAPLAALGGWSHLMGAVLPR